MRKMFFGAMACMLICGYAFAQAPSGTHDQSRDTTRESSMSPEKMARHWEENTARCLILDNQSEVVLNEFALDRIQNSDLKDFAQSMVKIHKEGIAKLERFAPNAMSTDSLTKRVMAMRSEMKNEKGTIPVSSETGESSRESAMSSQEEKQMEGKHLMHIIPAVQQQTVENCIAFTEAALSQIDKDNFDRAFLGQQIFTHIDMLSKLKAIQGYAPTELKPIINNQITVTHDHLEKAMSICKQWDEKSETNERRKD